MGSASTPPPPQNNPGKDLLKYVSGLQGALPSLADLEKQYRPEFGALNLGDISQMLIGSGNQQGILGLGGQATAASQQQLQAARQAELTGATGMAGGALGLLGAINPAGQRIANQSAQLADQRFAASQGLNMQESRMADQTAREAFASRGRLNDNASVAAEILGREEVLAGKRAEAMQIGGQAAQLNQQFTDPALALLTGAPASVALGQDYLNTGKQAVGANTPQLIDTGAGISLGQQNSANLASWAQNSSAAKNAARAQNTQAGASLLGSIATIAASAASASDQRIKEDIKRVGKTDDGLPIYTYKLMGDPKTQMGVMAQEVKKKKPKALGPKVGGIMTVDYSKIS